MIQSVPRGAPPAPEFAATDYDAYGGLTIILDDHNVPDRSNDGPSPFQLYPSNSASPPLMSFYSTRLVSPDTDVHHEKPKQEIPNIVVTLPSPYLAPDSPKITEQDTSGRHMKLSPRPLVIPDTAVHHAKPEQEIPSLILTPPSPYLAPDSPRITEQDTSGRHLKLPPRSLVIPDTAAHHAKPEQEIPSLILTPPSPYLTPDSPKITEQDTSGRYLLLPPPYYKARRLPQSDKRCTTSMGPEFPNSDGIYLAQPVVAEADSYGDTDSNVDRRLYFIPSEDSDQEEHIHIWDPSRNDEMGLTLLKYESRHSKNPPQTPSEWSSSATADPLETRACPSRSTPRRSKSTSLLNPISEDEVGEQTTEPRKHHHAKNLMENSNKLKGKGKEVVRGRMNLTELNATGSSSRHRPISSSLKPTVSRPVPSPAVSTPRSLASRPSPALARFYPHTSKPSSAASYISMSTPNFSLSPPPFRSTDSVFEGGVPFWQTEVPRSLLNQGLYAAQGSSYVPSSPSGVSSLGKRSNLEPNVEQVENADHAGHAAPCSGPSGSEEVREATLSAAQLTGSNGSHVTVTAGGEGDVALDDGATFKVEEYNNTSGRTEKTEQQKQRVGGDVTPEAEQTMSSEAEGPASEMVVIVLGDGPVSSEGMSPAKGEENDGDERSDASVSPEMNIQCKEKKKETGKAEQSDSQSTEEEELKKNGDSS